MENPHDPVLVPYEDTRVKELEVLILVYEATVYCLSCMAASSPNMALFNGQVRACAEAHRNVMDEPAMFDNSPQLTEAANAVHHSGKQGGRS